MLHRGSNYSPSRATDGRIVRRGIISSRQSAATSDIVKRCTHSRQTVVLDGCVHVSECACLVKAPGLAKLISNSIKSLMSSSSVFPGFVTGILILILIVLFGTEKQK